MITSKKVLISTVFLSLFGLLFLGTVNAHSVMEKATPSDGSKLDRQINTVELTFNTKVEIGSSLYLKTEDGQTIQPETVEVTSDTLTATFASNLGPGTYQVIWEVLGADGHIISNQYSFSVVGTHEQDTSEPEGNSQDNEPKAEQSEEQPDTETASESTDTGDDSGSYVIIILLLLAGVGLLAWIWFSRGKN